MRITSDQPEWMRTFPHLVEPTEGEWLPGFLLRCDEANGWTPGTTVNFAARYSTGPSGHGRSQLLALALHLDLGRLASALSAPKTRIVRLTFQNEIARFFGRAEARGHLLGPIPPFRICPACVKDGRYLSRDLALGLLRTCRTHHLVLKERCECSAQLRPFNRRAGVQAFACDSCGLDWGDLPGVPADDDVLSFDAYVHELYWTLLRHGTGGALGRARRFIIWRTRAGGWPELPRGAFARSRLPPFARLATLTTIADWVASLAALSVEARELSNLEVPRSAPVPYVCPNRSCPHFGRRGAGNVHLFANHETWANRYYCNECGSRFSADGRLIVTFDANHGDPRITEGKVREAINRLQGWKASLEQVCQRMIVDVEPISVERAFRKAAIPQDANLRARRLGLVGIVERYATRQLTELSAQGRLDFPMRNLIYRRSR